MSNPVKLTAAVSLPSGININEVLAAPRLTGLTPTTASLGPLAAFAGNLHGNGFKQVRSHARWMMVEAAQQMDRHVGPLGVFFRRKAKSKNRNIAVVATARKLVTIAWHMLKNNEPYRYAQPSTIQAKFDRLRIRATGKKKKGGQPKGTPRSERYGQGRTRAVPALSSIYAEYGLPALAPPRSGERAMLERHALTVWSDSLQQPRRAAKGKGKP